MDLLALTRRLIDIPSVTGEEREVGEWLFSYLEDLDYRVECQYVADDRFNIFARTASPPRIVFSTHMDTVPPFLGSSEDEEYIYGRGSCDAKGIIAAQIIAAERLRRAGFEHLGLLFTVDEELASAGAQLANKQAVASDCEFLINGEPTDNLLAVGTKGSMRIILTTAGKAGHSAYPEAGESAIEKLLDVLDSVRQIRWADDPFFGATTSNIGVISGGTRPNVIADKASAELQIRLSGSIDLTKTLLRQAIRGRAKIEFASAHAPVRLFSLPGWKESVVRFTTDVPYLSNWGNPLLLGPGSILDAHTEHERVSKRELEEAVGLYEKLATTLSVSGDQKVVRG